MRYYENRCCDCGIWCRNCGRRHVEIIECDFCGAELTEDEATTEDGKDYCIACYEKITEE